MIKNIPKQNSYKEHLSMSEMVMKFQRATKSPQYILLYFPHIVYFQVHKCH